MAERAARIALDRAGMTGADVDAVLVATVTHPYQTPSAASLLAHRIGATPAAAIDLSAACAGFCYGLGLTSDMIRGGSASTVLVVGAEKLSDFTDPTDRSTAFIFGDGAGAVLVTGSTEPGIGPTVWGSDGGQWDAINMTRPWVGEPPPAVLADPVAVAAAADDGPREPTVERPYLRMAGQTVFRWAVWQMAPAARKALEAAGVEADDLAAFIPHQANARIIDAMAKQLGLPAHVPVARSIVDTGNTSAASVPLAMDRMLTEGTAAPGGLALLIGFGAGLSYAGQVVRLPEVADRI